MARKRGGIAGFFDKNKKWLKPVAAFTAGMINPALGAAVGAAMGGLDREGKRGIGLDLGGAVKGGVTGYGLGKLGAAAKGGLGGLFTGAGKSAASGIGGAPASAAGGLPGAPVVTDVTSRIATQVPELVTKVNPATLFAPAAAPAVGGGTLANVGNFLTKNSGLITGAGRAVAGVLGQQAERDQYADQLAIQRERLDLEREQDRREQERRERVARLLMPLFQQQAALVNQRGTV